MTDRQKTNSAERKLSLYEMLTLADQVDSWQHFSQRDFFLSFTPEHYIGQINEIVIEIGQSGATPWGGWLRYIYASYGNVYLGTWSGFDGRLDKLFYRAIPEKIRRRGFEEIERISRERQQSEIERKQEAIQGENI